MGDLQLDFIEAALFHTILIAASFSPLPAALARLEQQREEVVLC